MSQLLLSFYGDDFTGSTDAMEALAKFGVKTVLFTRLPSPDEFAPYKDYQSIGLAGTSRSQTPEWMDGNLTAALSWLKGLNARFCHYKVCSTFDSSPAIGSIGRAMEIGCRIFGQRTAPIVVGCPQIKRYTAFGHLFAAYQGVVYRIDRHPVMSRHPVTPMHESDLAIHLSHQTKLPVELLDVMDDATQLAAGQKLLESGPFIVGSSGVEFALLRALNITAQEEFRAISKERRIAVVSGSCSPMTERQIRHGLANGFEGLEIDPQRPDVEAATAQALSHLNAGRSIIVYTALGAASAKLSPAASEELGHALGRLSRALVERAELKRLVIAGGDTSGHALSELGAFALTTRMPVATAPGAPLCALHGGPMQGLEIALKGGQIGQDDYFALLRDGGNIQNKV